MEQPFCTRCGSGSDLTVDHVVPGSLEGGVRVLCRRCHGEVGMQRNRKGYGGTGSIGDVVPRLPRANSYKPT